MFRSSSRLYISDYTNDDWFGTGSSGYISPVVLRSRYVGSGGLRRSRSTSLRPIPVTNPDHCTFQVNLPAVGHAFAVNPSSSLPPLTFQYCGKLRSRVR